MFREMRRLKQKLSEEDARQVLQRGMVGVLAVLGDDGYPYTVPINYTYFNNAIYFHCALSGHKIDAIEACGKVSFCVIDKDDVVPDRYTSYYRSVVAFGRAHIVEDDEEKLASLRNLGDRYNPGEDAALDAAVAKGFAHLHMVRIDIEHLSGKQAKELMANSSIH